jgi:Spy/CpxP family protein refolding chaperone
MKTRMSIISFLAVMVLCFSAYDSYAYGGPRGRGFEGRQLKWVLAKSGVPLTDEQETQIKGIFQEHRDQLKATRTALSQARRDLQTSILSSQLPDDQIKNQVDAKIVPQIGTIAENRAVIYNQIVWTVLTIDQRAALQAQASSKQVQP